MLKCSRCQTYKVESLEFFPPNKAKKNGLDSWCRSCRSEYRSVNRIPKGISQSEIPKAIEAKNYGECVICGMLGLTVINHDHKTGKVIGPLCMNCNLGLGHFKDDIELLELAILYLKGECACGKCIPKWGGDAAFVCQ